MDVKDRIENSIQRVTESGCWIWLLCTFKNGYAQIRLDGRTQYAHRVSYQVNIGNIPEGLTLDHSCRVRCCVNPAHLSPMTRSENSRGADSANKGKHHRDKTHCKNGHPFDDTNTYLGSRIRAGKSYPTRACKTCHGGWKTTQRSAS